MTATSQLQALREHATALGIETSYRDVSGQHHDTPEHTLRQLCDVLEDDRGHRTAAARTGRRVRRRRRPVDRRRDLALGGAAARRRLRGRAAGRSTAGSAFPPTFPSAATGWWRPATAASEEATLVVPPATMPRADRFAGQGRPVRARVRAVGAVVAAAVVHPPRRARSASARPSASTCCRPCRCTPPSSTSRSTPARTRRPAGCTGTRSTSTTPRCRFSSRRRRAT